MIDNISSDEIDISDELEDVVVDSNIIRVEHTNNSITNTENQQQIDTRSKQKMMNIGFSSLVLSQIDEIEIDLFHLFKSSNAQLILFDWEIDWVKIYEGSVIH